MPKIIETSTGQNFLQKFATPADKSFINDVQLYEKYNGSDGLSSNTIFNLNGSYIPGTNTLMVFVNGQKVEKVVTATDETEYEETDNSTITFGDSLLDTDIVEFYVTGTYNVEETDIDNLVINGTIPTQSFKNKIINGNFDIWQRQTSQTTNGYASDDRWGNYNGGSSTKTHSRQTFTLGQTDVPGEPKYFSRTVVTTGSLSNSYTIKQQRLEFVEKFSDKQIIISFWAKADATKDIAVEFAQVFGSGGTPSTLITAIGVQKFTLSTSWQKFTHIVSLPSVSGKTLGTDNNDYLRLNFWFDAGSDYNVNTDFLGTQSGTFDLAQVQLEEGNKATPFENRFIGVELALCQRYYLKTYRQNDFPGTIVTNGREIVYITNVNSSDHTIIIAWDFPQTMRGAPTIVTYSDTTGSSGVVRMISGDVTPTSVIASDKSVNINANNGVASSFRLLTFHATADAEL